MNRLCLGRMQRFRITNLIIFENQMEEPCRVAARCPTCGHVAETHVIGRYSIPNPLPRDTVELHADCDLTSLYNELSTAAQKLSEYFDWR